MAAFTVNVSKHATLGAGVADAVLIDRPVRAVVLVNRAASGIIYATVQQGKTSADVPVAVAPVAAADNTIPIPFGQRVTLVEFDGERYVRVNLISAAADAYSVVGLQFTP
jgi:hypothetical protein